MPTIEDKRLRALGCLQLLDTDPTESFDQITRLASQLFNVPIALVSLVASDRQWFKSRFGLDVAETSRDMSFCSRAMQLPGVMVIEDAAADPLYADNALVTGYPHIRFYAGAPLVLPTGEALGSLCIIDHVPRTISETQKKQLETLAAFVMAQVELHRRAGRVHEITRLPNRTQMFEDFESLVRKSPGETRGMLLVDVMKHDRLQDAVRAVGIPALEATLTQLAQKLQDFVGADWPIYHVTDTRFCIQMRGETRSEREAFCHSVLSWFGMPLETNGVPVQLQVEAGLVEFELDTAGAADALRKATAAMHEASARSEAFRWHDEALDLLHSRAYGVMHAVEGSLQAGEFRLVYQPKFDVRKGLYRGVEALARWEHPTFGNVSPGEFVPLVERSQLIHAFTHWVIDSALRQTAHWQRAGLFLTVAVNVSSRNLEHPGFVDSVSALLSKWNVSPQWLHVECTENAVMTGEATRRSLLDLRALGMRVSLDDFGMGYSNLSCLRGLPVHMLKLDQSLIKPIDTDKTALELVKSLIHLGHSLGFSMLAEGVETAEVCDLLIAAQCDALQGYYLARPMEADLVSLFMAAPPVVPGSTPGDAPASASVSAPAVA